MCFHNRPWKKYSIINAIICLQEILYVLLAMLRTSSVFISLDHLYSWTIFSIQNFTVDNQLQSLTLPPMLVGNTTSQGNAPSPGCIVSTPCQTSPCQNGGTCVDYWLSYECSCPLGFEGTYCEIQTLASFEPDKFLHFGAGSDVIAADTVISSIKFSFTAGSGDQGLMFYMVSGVQNMNLTLSIQLGKCYTVNDLDCQSLVLRSIS